MTPEGPGEPTGVFRILVGLIGLAVFGAVFAGLAQDAASHRRSSTAFQIAPGEARTDQVQPGSGDGNITVDVEVVQGVVDIFVVEAALTPDLVRGQLRLDRPFSYRAEYSRLHVAGNLSVELPADTTYDIVLDNSDAYYEGDATPDGVAVVELKVRYPVDEKGSLVLGVVAALPSLLLVGFTLARALRRHGRRRRAARE